MHSYKDSKYFRILGEELLKSERSSWPVITITDKSGKQRKVRINPAKQNQQEKENKPKANQEKPLTIRQQKRASKVLEDKQLIDRALHGNPVEKNKSLSMLYVKYKDDAFKIIHSFVRDEEQAKDLVADNFIKVIKQLPSYEKLSDTLNFKVWFTRVTANSARDFLRSAVAAFRKNAISEEEKKTRFKNRADVTNPEDDAIATEQAERIKSAMDKLPQEYRSAIEDYYFKGKTVKEIAQSQNISASGAQLRLVRGKDALRKLLSPELFKAVQLQFDAIDTLEHLEIQNC